VAHLIAAHHQPYPYLAEALAQATGEDFLWLADPAEMNFDRIKRLDPAYIFLVHWSYRVPSEISERFEPNIYHMPRRAVWKRRLSPSKSHCSRH
jgi:hypothetical protein